MSKIRFIGDVHGHTFELGLVLKNLPEHIDSVIQVGDMGVGFGQGNYWHQPLDILMQKHNAKFIRGNHDNPGICKTMNSWIPDAVVENDIMYLGGAWSIDRAWRTEGISWWQDEELSIEELSRAIDVYNLTRPKIMVTHDCPHDIAGKLFFEEGKSNYGMPQHPTRTGKALEAMLELHKPNLHVFGHWHQDVDEVINGTRFICLNELSYVDVDTETLEVTWPGYQQKRGKP